MPILTTGGGGKSTTVAFSGAIFDGVNSQATISNANLTATHNSAVLGGARSASNKNSGLLYFEMTVSTVGSSNAVGLLTAAGTFTNFVSGGTNCVAVYASGQIWSNGANSTKTLGAMANGDIIGVAMDFGNAKVWARKSPAGLWNGDASANPATNTNGVSTSSFSATTLSPAIGWTNAAGGVVTMNSGASAFSGVVPAGFTAGWPL